MRLRPPAIITGALLAIAVAAAPAQAGAPARAATPDTAPASTAGSALGSGPAGTALPAGPVQLRDPGPECTGQGGGCWEYYTWYWTYSSCHDEGRAQLQNNPRRYDNYNCAGGHGLVVWLWLHRP